MRRFFTKRIHIYFPTATSDALKLPIVAKRMSGEIAYESCNKIYKSAHFLAGNCKLTLREISYRQEFRDAQLLFRSRQPVL